MPRFQAIDQNGHPMVGATLYTYQNKTTTPHPTWKDKDQTAYNTNPIVLDARGEAVIWLDPEQVYTFVLRDWLGVLVWSQDDVVGSALQIDLDALRADLASAAEDKGAAMVGYTPPRPNALSAATVDGQLTRLTTADSRYDCMGWPRGKLEVIAHRGWRDISPESTLLAFSAAKQLGADSIECDVQITLDGVPVVFHDATVDAQTDGTGPVSGLTLAQFLALKLDQVSSSIYSDARLATFEEVCQIAKTQGLLLYPEIKDYRTDDDIELMFDVVNQYQLNTVTCWNSTRLSDLEKIRSLQSDAIVSLSAFSVGDALSMLPELKALGYPAILYLNYPVAGGQAPGDIQVRELAISYGIDVVAFTVPFSRDAHGCLGNGINKILTNVNLRGSL